MIAENLRKALSALETLSELKAMLDPGAGLTISVSVNGREDAEELRFSTGYGGIALLEDFETCLREDAKVLVSLARREAAEIVAALSTAEEALK